MRPYRSGRLYWSVLSICAVLVAALSVNVSAQVSTKPGWGATPYTGGTTFRTWAPNATAVSVTGTFNGWSTVTHPLSSEGSSGVWSRDVVGALAGDQYRYAITHNGSITSKIDSRAYDVTNSVGNGVITSGAFTWTNSYTQPAWNKIVIYEMHIGTFNDTAGGAPGTWTTAVAKLDDVRDLGVTHLEVMPIAEFAGDYSWGYNPAHPWAPESAYGTPEQMKTFVDEAHGRGMGVIVDVVYNHMGPSDLALWRYDGWSQNNKGGIYFYQDWRSSTPWGDTRPDYGRDDVRSYLKNNALYWLNDFRCDGLRWDSTVNIRTQNNGGGGDIPDGWSLMKWVNEQIDANSSWKISIAEDLQNNSYITNTTSSGAKFDSQWDAQFVHPIRQAIITTWDADRDMNAVAAAITHKYNSSHTQRVIYTESHDEVNNGHSRVPEEINPGNATSWASRKRSTLGAAIVMTSPGIPMIFMGQEFLEWGYWSDADPLNWGQKVTYAGIWNLYRDLIRLRRDWYSTTKGLSGNNVNVHHVSTSNKIVAYHRWLNGGAKDDVIVLANFSNTGYSGYNIGFPRAGSWKVRFNGDSTGYGFNGWASNATNAVSGAKHGMNYNANVGIGPYTVIILSQDN